MKSIFETEEDLNFFDKVMRLLTQNRIFEITSMSWIFDSVMLATQVDLKAKGIIHFRTTLTWIIAQVVTPVLLQLHMLFVIQGTAPLFCSKSLSYQECKKKCSSFGKNPDFVHPEVKFTVQNIVLRVSRTKSSNIFCCRTIFLDFLRKCLLKHPNFKNSPLPWTISCCAPAYIWYKQSDFCSLELYWQYLQKSWWSSSIIPKKVTWVLFPARINTLYSKLPPINDLFLNSLFAIDVLAEYQIRKFFSAMLHQNIVRQNKFLKFSPNFLHLLCWFCHCNNNSISGETCKVVNW